MLLFVIFLFACFYSSHLFFYLTSSFVSTPLDFVFSFIGGVSLFFILVLALMSFFTIILLFFANICRFFYINGSRIFSSGARTSSYIFNSILSIFSLFFSFIKARVFNREFSYMLIPFFKLIGKGAAALFYKLPLWLVGKFLGGFSFIVRGFVSLFYNIISLFGGVFAFYVRFYTAHPIFFACLVMSFFMTLGGFLLFESVKELTISNMEFQKELLIDQRDFLNGLVDKISANQEKIAQKSFYKAMFKGGFEFAVTKNPVPLVSEGASYIVDKIHDLVK